VFYTEKTISEINTTYISTAYNLISVPFAKTNFVLTTQYATDRYLNLAKQRRQTYCFLSSGYTIKRSNKNPLINLNSPVVSGVACNDRTTTAELLSLYLSPILSPILSLFVYQSNVGTRRVSIGQSFLNRQARPVTPAETAEGSRHTTATTMRVPKRPARDYCWRQ